MCAMRIFRMYTRSKIDYSLPKIAGAAQSNLKILRPIITEAIRLATGAFRSTPVESLHAIAKEITLLERSKFLSCT